MAVKQVLIRASRSLGHPLVLIVAGAFISSYLIPSLTRQWQNHERELEIKAVLVQEMSETTAEFVVAIKTYAFGGFGSGQTPEGLIRDLSRDRRAFDTQQPITAAKLRAYFRKASLTDEWNRYGAALVSFFDVIRTTDANFKRQKLAKLERYLGGNANFGALVSPEATGTEYRNAFLAAEEFLFAQKDVLVRAVLEADSAL